MKKILVILLTVTVSLLGFAGCAKTEEPVAAEVSENTASETPEANEEISEKLSVILLVPGNLGDKSFFDAANNGINLVSEEIGAATKVVEMGTDSTKWEPNFLDAIDGDYDIIISGNSTTELMDELALEYPDQKFINFDTMTSEHPENVYSMFYSTNELSFLSGACAALITGSDMELANEEQIIGFLGGMDIPGINDFLVGYIEGAKYINPDIQMFISYAGDFGDPAKGKELSLVQYNSGADVIFNVAGGTGLGIIDAAKEVDKYAIGVDSDQAMLFEETDKEKAEHIVTSAVKYIDKAILRAVKMHSEETLPYGTHEEMGVKEGGVGLAENNYYNSMLSEESKAKINEIKDKMIAGEITVNSAFGMTTEEIDQMRDSVKVGE